MVTVAPGARTFSGSKAEQANAAELFRLMQTVGRFMSVNASIRLALDSATEFFADQNISQKEILAAVALIPMSSGWMRLETYRRSWPRGQERLGGPTRRSVA